MLRSQQLETKVESSTTKSSRHTVFINKRCFKPDILEQPDEILGLTLLYDSHLALFKASLIAAHARVVEVEGHDYPFVRDPVVMIHDEKLVISCEGNEAYGSQSIIDTLKNYKHIVIPNAYFEGGNMIFLPSAKVLFHGLHPEGHYPVNEDSNLLASPESYYKIDPVDSNRSLNAHLGSYGITVEGLAIHPDIMTSDDDEVRAIYYYHLDCFMQVLPDGRVVVLNKNILSNHSWARLQEFLGDKLIDLAYPDYLSTPFIFNFVAIPSDDKCVLIAPSLPGKVKKALKKLGLKVVVPESLNNTSDSYDRQFAKEVVKAMRGEGFALANEANLNRMLFRDGYSLNNGKTLDLETVKRRVSFMASSINDQYQAHPLSFLISQGGPHCLTLEIPESPKLSAYHGAFFSSSAPESAEPEMAKLLISDAAASPI